MEDERSMISVAEVKAREGYRIWIRFADGCAGEIDLSDLAGKGVFRAWDNQDLFAPSTWRRTARSPGRRRSNSVPTRSTSI